MAIQTLEDLDFVDDIAFVLSTNKQMQRKTDELVKLAAKSGLSVSKPKTRINLGSRRSTNNHNRR